MPESIFYKINAPKVVFEVYDDEIIFMNLENGNYYNVTNPAAEICILVNKDYSFEEIIQYLMLKYSGSKDSIYLAVTQFLAKLEKEGILIRTEPDTKRNPDDLMETLNTPVVSDKPLFDIPVLNCYSDMQQLILLDPVHEVGEAGWPNPKPDQK